MVKTQTSLIAGQGLSCSCLAHSICGYSGAIVDWLERLGVVQRVAHSNIPTEKVLSVHQAVNTCFESQGKIKLGSVFNMMCPRYGGH